MTADRATTDRASASSPAIDLNSQDRHGFHALQGAPPAGITKPPGVVKSEMTAQQRDAIKAFGQLVITIEQAFPQAVADAPASRTITRPGPGDGREARSAHAAEFLRNVIDSTARSLSRRGEATPRTVPEAYPPAQRQSAWQRASIGVGLPASPSRQPTQGRHDPFSGQATSRGSYER
jgi:hypothetical protein